MKKQSLMIARDIILDLENANEQLSQMLDLLNINDEERRRIEDAILVTIEKIEETKKSKISNLQEHIDIEFIDRVFTEGR